MLRQPALDGVGRFGGGAAVEADRPQLRPRLAAVGDHQRVAAEQRRSRVALVIKVESQAFFGQQAAEEGEIAFLILNAVGLRAVHAAVGQVEAEIHRQLRAALIVGQELGENVDHAGVLKHPAVAPPGQHRQRRLDNELVAGEAAVGGEQTRLGDLAMQRAQRGAAGIGLPFEKQRLADQGGEVEVGVAGERGDAKGVAGARAAAGQRQVGQPRPIGVGLQGELADGREVGGQAEQGFHADDRFAQEDILAEQGMQAEQTVGLLPVGGGQEVKHVL